MGCHRSDTITKSLRWHPHRSDLQNVSLRWHPIVALTLRKRCDGGTIVVSALRGTTMGCHRSAVVTRVAARATLQDAARSVVAIATLIAVSANTNTTMGGDRSDRCSGPHCICVYMFFSASCFQKMLGMMYPSGKPCVRLLAATRSACGIAGLFLVGATAAPPSFAAASSAMRAARRGTRPSTTQRRRR